MDPIARYKLIAGVIHSQLAEILGKIDESWKDYQTQQLQREDYYRECTDMSTKIGELSKNLIASAALD